jgi:hypothetical protein
MAAEGGGSGSEKEAEWPQPVTAKHQEKSGRTEHKGIGECTSTGFHYGFPEPPRLNEKQRSELVRASEKQLSRTFEWRSRRSGDDLRIPSSQRKLKRLARRGIPPSCRPAVWMHASGAKARKAAHPPGYYGELATRLPEKQAVEQIDNDVRRTFPHNPRLRSQQARAQLRRILLAYARYNPAIGYCQSMNYLAGFAFVVLGSEESAFWLLVAVMEERLYPGTHSTDLSGSLIEFNTLHKLLRIYFPKLARHLDACECHLAFICCKWILCVFADNFPPETAARVWDCFLVEGSKIFHRISMAILARASDELFKSNDIGEMMCVLEKTCNSELDPDGLIYTAFNMPRPLSRRRINHCRVESRNEFEAEQRRRNQVCFVLVRKGCAEYLSERAMMVLQLRSGERRCQQHQIQASSRAKQHQQLQLLDMS